MSVLFDETVQVNALTDPGLADPLEPERDELYQQSIALRGDEFLLNPANPANLRDGTRFVAKAIGKLATASNCSNSYLVRSSGDALSAEEMAGALRDGTGRVPPTTCADNDPPAPVQDGIATFESGIVFIEEVASDLWRSDHPSGLAPNFRAALTEHLGADARHVHTYERFPQLFTASPDDWRDLSVARPELGGIWLQLYGYDGDSTLAWDEARYATWLRPYTKDFLAAAGDIRRLHLLMTASFRSAALDPTRSPGDQWPWARTGAACELLRNGPGAYRIGRGSEPWREFGQGYRDTFGALGPAEQPADLAAAGIDCTPAYRLTDTTSPSAEDFAQTVASLGGGALELPGGSIIFAKDSSGEIAVDVASGLPSWLDPGFAERAGAVVTGVSGGTSATVPVGSDGIARLVLSGSAPNQTTFELSGIRGSELLASARQDGRLPDPHLSLLCDGAVLPDEAVEGQCVDVIRSEPGRPWMPAEASYGWLLASTTMTAPSALLTETAAAGGGGTGKPTAPGSGQAPPPSPATCKMVPPRGTPKRVVAPSRITVSYLRTNQRTGSATIRRANAIDAWIDAGIEGRDICGGAIGPEKLGPSLSWAIGSLGPAPTPPDPRALRIAPAAKKNVRFTETALQMCVNQRVYQTAIVRTNALAERLGRLRGGDVEDATLTRAQLRQDLTILRAAQPATPQAPSSTDVRPPERSGCGAVRFTPAQAAINRRIAIASVVRVNRLVDNLAAGLSGPQFLNRSLSGSDFDPGVVG